MVGLAGAAYRLRIGAASVAVAWLMRALFLLPGGVSDIKARSFLGARFLRFIGVAGKTLKKRGAERQMTLSLSGQPMPGWACGFRGLMYVESLSSYR